MEININIPSKWDELTDWQLIKIANTYRRSGRIFDFMIWLYLNHVKWYEFKRAYQLRIVLNNVPLSELKNNYKWIYTQIDRTKFPKHKRYQRPMDRIVDVTIQEFAVADDLNNMYLKTGDISYLKLLTAVLYRPKRESYNHLDLEKNIKRFKKDKNAFFKAVHLAFNGSKKGIVDKFTHVYPKIKVQQKSNKKSGLLDVVLKMSGGKFGTYNETKNTLLYTFLTELEESIVQQEKMQEKYGKKH